MALRLRNLELRRALHARRPSLAGDDQRHLAAGLVDHLVAEHRGALLAARLGREVLVRVQDQLGVVVVLLRGREDLVGGLHLARVQHPLAVEAEGRGALGDLAVAVDVADLQVGAVDRLEVVGTGGHQDLHQDVVVGVRRVAGRLLAHDQRLHVDRRHEVGRAEDDGLDALGRRRDLVDVVEALRVLDLRLDADLADLEAHRLLDLGQQEVERDDLLGGLHLRQHDAVEVLAGTFDDRDDIAVRPLGRPVVDAHDPRLAGPVALVEELDDGVPRLGLGERSARVLQVEEDLVRREALRLLQEAGIASRHRETRAAGTQTGDGHAGTSRGSSLFAFRISSTMRPMIPVMSKSFGVKTAATPAARNCSASPLGMIPPAMTGTSVAPATCSRSSTSGTSCACEPDRMDRPTACTSSARAASTICSGVSRMPWYTTSKPASRARTAICSAPLECPSRPGLPTRKRSFPTPMSFAVTSTLRRTSAMAEPSSAGTATGADDTPVGARNSPNTSRSAPAHSPVVTPARAHSRVASMRLAVPLAASFSLSSVLQGRGWLKGGW